MDRSSEGKRIKLAPTTSREARHAPTTTTTTTMPNPRSMQDKATEMTSQTSEAGSFQTAKLQVHKMVIEIESKCKDLNKLGYECLFIAVHKSGEDNIQMGTDQALAVADEQHFLISLCAAIKPDDSPSEKPTDEWTLSESPDWSHDTAADMVTLEIKIEKEDNDAMTDMSDCGIAYQPNVDIGSPDESHDHYMDSMARKRIKIEKEDVPMEGMVYQSLEAGEESDEDHIPRSDGAQNSAASVMGPSCSSVSMDPGNHIVGAVDHTVGVEDFAVTAGDCAVAAGDHAVCTGDYALGTGDHVLGAVDHAVGVGDHAVGAEDRAVGAGDHVVGAEDHAVGVGDHAVGAEDRAGGAGDHAIGVGDHAVGARDHDDGVVDLAVGAGDHAVGAGDHGIGDHAIGVREPAVGIYQMLTNIQQQLKALPGSKTGMKGPTIFNPPLSTPEEYNIREILTGHLKGRRVLEELDQGRMPSIINRRALIQLAVQHLIDYGGKHLYPTRTQKESLAVAIVTQFPCMKDTLGGVQGHEYLFTKGSGFIEYRLKTLRTTHRTQTGLAKPKAPAIATNSKAHSDNPDGDSVMVDVEVPAEILRKIEWLKHNPATLENVQQIRSYYKDTHGHRMRLISEGKQTFTDAIRSYPCYREMPNLIAYDFSLKFGEEIGDALTTWQADFAERILGIARTDKNSSVEWRRTLYEFGEEGDGDLCALYILVDMLPSSNGFRPTGRKRTKDRSKPTKSKADAVNHLFQHEPMGTDVATYAASGKPEELKQPFLLCLGPKTKPEKFFIVADHEALPAGNSTMDAFDLLFKAHHIFNIEYDIVLRSFFTFFAAAVYKCTTNKVSAQIIAFNLLLNSHNKDAE